MANRFDEMAKLLASGVSRRQALKVLGGSIIGGIFAGKAVGEAGAFNKYQLAQGCKSHCSAAVASYTKESPTPSSATVASAYQLCLQACEAPCPGSTATGTTQPNLGGPDNMCGQLTVNGTTFNRASCCGSAMPCGPDRNTCRDCAPGQFTCRGNNGNTTKVCCSAGSTCMNISGGAPMCVANCPTVMCNGQCCRNGNHCGQISNGPLMCLPGASF